ncbi:MAG: DNA internalization-related competence protein ComEC/Rec2 [Candidatus Izemoplasmatales bacterium]|nr:DNA internalization-related competence protein ComEC/Rec2 [Candidatus Izemoplasmatales bacterium]
MSRLKTILQYDSSKFIHLAIVSVLFCLSKNSYLAIVLLIAELILLFYSSKNLLIYAFIIMTVLFVRFSFTETVEFENEGQIIKVEEERITVENKYFYHLYLENTDIYQVGMVVRFKGEPIDIDVKNLPDNFDYFTYLKSSNIKDMIKVEDISIIDQQFTWRIIPEHVKTIINGRYDELTAKYLKLFILGDNDDLDQMIMDKTRVIGISHLFAISGMHLGLIIGFITFVLDKFYLRKKTHHLIIGGFLVLYNILTAFSVSIVRASLLTASLFLMKNRDFTKTDYLSFIMVGFLIYNPYLLFNVGFVLSFLVSFTIIMGKFIWVDKEKVVQVLKIGVLANLVSLPIIIGLNGSYGLMNIFYNVVFVYFVSFLFLPLSFIILVFPELTKLYQSLINLFELLVNFSYEVNYYLEFSFENNILKVLYWLSLLGLFINYKNGKKRIFTFSAVFILTLSIYSQNYNYFNYVRILDVNQGDAIHLHSNKCDILIDTGYADDYDGVLNYFLHENIKEIDILILSHIHSDHFGEANDILKNIEVKKLIVNKYNKKVNYNNQIVLKKDESIKCGDIVLQNLNKSNSENENNNSMVLYGKIGNDNWLFTGDIEVEVEQETLKNYTIDIDVLKVAHHGSTTSSTEEFLDFLTPKYALISVGKNNYKHPDEEVLKRFSRRNIEVFRTDIEGTITFYYFPYIDGCVIETYLLEKRPKYTIKN